MMTTFSIGAKIRPCPAQLQVSGALKNFYGTRPALLGCAYGIREYWSVGIWRLLDRIERECGKPESGKRPRRRALGQPRGHGRSDLWLGRLIDSLAGLAGLASETLPRAAAFRFFDLGRRIERGVTASSVLARILESTLTGEAERESLSLVLQSADSLITFRRRYRNESAHPNRG